MASLTASLSPALSNNSKVLALETTLQQGITHFKDLLIDLEKLQIDSDNSKIQLMKHKEKCDSKACSGAEELKKALDAKDNIIQLAASALTRLNETKDWNILEDVFKILLGETTTGQDQDNSKSKEVSTPIKKDGGFIRVKSEFRSPIKNSILDDESASEIEGTPTGRTSPIILTKKQKSSMVGSADKKKCPSDWSVPQPKAIKLVYPTPTRNKPNTRLRQSRINLVRLTTTNFVDITSTPEFSGGNRGNRTETESPAQPPIKKESMENDDTILPSPTSGTTNFTMFKSPMNVKKALSLKGKPDKSNKKTDEEPENKITIKTEQVDIKDEDIKICIDNIKMNNSVTYTQEDSINILQPERLPNNFLNTSPVKIEHNDTTFCDTQASVSLLQHVNKLDDLRKEEKPLSPSKRPLAENINFTNVPDDEEDDELHASMSLLQQNAKVARNTSEQLKRKIPQPIEIDEEDAPRTRAEKRQLPGWTCAKCAEFFEVLHEGDPEKIAQQKLNGCSHHRGVNNPERPKTPPRYWNPRWHIPDDTEEFNKRNNV